MCWGKLAEVVTGFTGSRRLWARYRRFAQKQSLRLSAEIDKFTGVMSRIFNLEQAPKLLNAHIQLIAMFFEQRVFLRLFQIGSHHLSTHFLHCDFWLPAQLDLSFGWVAQ